MDFKYKMMTRNFNFIKTHTQSQNSNYECPQVNDLYNTLPSHLWKWPYKSQQKMRLQSLQQCLCLQISMNCVISRKCLKIYWAGALVIYCCITYHAKAYWFETINMCHFNYLNMNLIVLWVSNTGLLSWISHGVAGKMSAESATIWRFDWG